ncbi:diguanylate cyclase [Mariprofundus erugo]|uniref:diguanylate cyclase n=1 Tax=Mariprofundus erugo TaxID=2528639 RepID=A0A5R9GL06_9PROT|nr:diguanylate cyclase [Mariprofundus erugo]TLS67196.1 diguanylate cyclase [Mariprofundus erugo]TLS73574.1 diguanylate cyclase [Mariprofundus erugo]
MSLSEIHIHDSYHTDHAIQIAPRVWWVGHVQENDPFQCHVYLIEQGDQSVLIDPGSTLTFTNTLEKIEEITPFSSIKYFICQHQDPDITGAMPLIEKMLTRDDAVIVTHWRTKMIIKHYGMQMPYWLLDDHDWRLPLEDRVLEFCFTPYAHFPGAFTTFDTASQIMFSSDIFGGLTEEFSLFAKGESYLECMKPFHQHYMPSNDILQYVLHEIEKYPMKMIAPQHGSIIPQHLIRFMINGLKSLDCGLYLLLRGTTDFRKLSAFNDTLKSITKTMTIYRDFKQIALQLLTIIRCEVATDSLEFYVQDINQGMIYLAASNQYRGKLVTPPAYVQAVFDSPPPATADNPGSQFQIMDHTDRTGVIKKAVMIALYLPEKGHVQAVILLHLADYHFDSEKLGRMVEQMRLPLQVAIEREMIYRDMDRERDKIYQRAIRDPLTGLFTRIYMTDFVHKMIEQQDRQQELMLAGVMIDIDHFKLINDTWGHNQGDIVLREVSRCVLDHCRAADIPVRLGGEEFIIFSQNSDIANSLRFAERLRALIAGLTWAEPMHGKQISASFGVAHRRKGEGLSDFIERIDSALYRAKESGRNRVCYQE